MGVNTDSFSMLYTCYYIPSMFTPMVGGFLMDKILGIRMGAVIFSVIIIIGKARDICVKA